MTTTAHPHKKGKKKTPDKSGVKNNREDYWVLAHALFYIQERAMRK